MPETGNNKIDYSKSEQYTLSIRLSTDGFSFSIYNPIYESSLSFFEKEIDPSLSLTANLKQVFRETKLLTLPYKRINILMASNRFTPVPSELFDDEQTETLFYHNHPKKENETVLYNVLSRNNITIIFGMDKSAYLFLKEQYPEARFYSQASPLSEYFSIKSRSVSYTHLWETNPTSYEIIEKTVNANDNLEIIMAKGGGQAITFIPVL